MVARKHIKGRVVRVNVEKAILGQNKNGNRYETKERKWIMQKALFGIRVEPMSREESEYMSEWVKIDDMLRGRLYSIEHIRTVRTLLENLPSEKWERDYDGIVHINATEIDKNKLPVIN